MSSSKTVSEKTLQFQKQNSVGCPNYRNSGTLKQKFIVGTLQENTSCLSHCRISLEANAGNVYEELIGESSFGGSFCHAETDSNFFGGNFRAAAFDDAQVVPDFNDVLETIHVDMDKTSVSSAPFADESESCASISQTENRYFPGAKRRNSERDELEIYFPCVLTPIPVDRLYSTLSDDLTVFKFPATTDEFLPDDESMHSLTSEHCGNYNSFSQDHRHSLDSFANLSIFSFPGGSEAKFDVPGNKLEQTPEIRQQQEASKSWFSTRGKGCGSSEERNRFSENGPECINKQHVFPPWTLTLGNNFKLQDFVTNSSRPKAINTVFGENKCETKVSTLRQSCETICDFSTQLNTAPVSHQYLEFPPNLTANTDPSQNPFWLDGWRNRCILDSSIERPILGKRDFDEGCETSSERSRTGFLERAPVEVNLSIPIAPESNCKKKPRRAKELSRNLNSGTVKTKATRNQENSDVDNYTELNDLDNSTEDNTRIEDGVEGSCKSRAGESLHRSNSRGFHNDMERQRRINMKTRFENLKMAVPELSDNKKASKITILRKALECIGMLEKESVELENLKRAERQRNIELLNKLQKITAGKS